MSFYDERCKFCKYYLNLDGYELCKASIKHTDTRMYIAHCADINWTLVCECEFRDEFKQK